MTCQGREWRYPSSCGRESAPCRKVHPWESTPKVDSAPGNGTVHLQRKVHPRRLEGRGLEDYIASVRSEASKSISMGPLTLTFLTFTFFATPVAFLTRFGGNPTQAKGKAAGERARRAKDSAESNPPENVTW